jgi:hypothetical protein
MIDQRTVFTLQVLINHNRLLYSKILISLLLNLFRFLTLWQCIKN